MTPSLLYLDLDIQRAAARVVLPEFLHPLHQGRAGAAADVPGRASLSHRPQQPHALPVLPLPEVPAGRHGQAR